MIRNPKRGMKVKYVKIGMSVRYAGRTTPDVAEMEGEVVEINYDGAKVAVKWYENGDQYVYPVEDLIPAIEDNIESIW